jgi:hypothetical protein
VFREGTGVSFHPWNAPRRRARTREPPSGRAVLWAGDRPRGAQGIQYPGCKCNSLLCSHLEATCSLTVPLLGGELSGMRSADEH